MTTKQKQSKRILSVTIRKMVDDSPDTSWLGEYSNSAETEYAIDRKHSLDCAINTGKVSEIPDTQIALYECGQCDCYHPWSWDGDCRDDANRFGSPEDYAERMGIDETCVIVYSAQDREDADEGKLCDCGEHSDMERNEYRYFNGPVENYKGESPEDIRKYILQDYKRMESLNRGDWCFIGIRADAEVWLGSQSESASNYIGPTQTITSGGLWGIESDSDDSYIADEEKDQLSELKDQLRALGFSTRAISEAFQNVQHKDE